MNEAPRHFYVDEAGDLTLLGRRGKSLLGNEGVSYTFMVGVARIGDPESLRHELDRLRQALLADRYFEHIPSMQLSAGKTARCFHAKDDCPEVRREVYRLLFNHDISVQVGIRRKLSLVHLAQAARTRRVRMQQNSVYDDLVKTLFKRQLHKADENRIYFARRGKSSRQEALERAIKKAQSNFSRDTGIPSERPTRVIPAVPSDIAGLQAVDYFLWALQRMYERGEDRYFNYLSGNFRLVMDFDDKRNGKDYGEWYSETNPLTLEKLLPVTG